jgi:hypothetical protein
VQQLGPFSPAKVRSTGPSKVHNLLIGKTTPPPHPPPPGPTDFMDLSSKVGVLAASSPPNPPDASPPPPTPNKLRVPPSPRKADACAAGGVYACVIRGRKGGVRFGGGVELRRRGGLNLCCYAGQGCVSWDAAPGVVESQERGIQLLLLLLLLLLSELRQVGSL